ncbi:hypothetical protein [Pseudanabaena sp. FACHB-2040]|uniref:hypothetical protein n=1 Tax=Pseudanabaena sp. FACHB-2040 TaxID=2692859 RepID=UPI0016852442|nr:hypothetical protein [Pseudanabaena sp. FACHB-2040]MBD2261058.1 hypothetical protein [Pseudanabaena sp. FACHB-2040]
MRQQFRGREVLKIVIGGSVLMMAAFVIGVEGLHQYRVYQGGGVWCFDLWDDDTYTRLYSPQCLEEEPTTELPGEMGS